MMFEEHMPNIDIDDLRFYFDSQEKNLIDQGKWGMRVGAVLDLRRKLLTLPQKEFDVAYEAIDRIVAPHADTDKDRKDREARQARSDGGAQLYNAVAEAGNVAASHGDEVSKI